MDLVRRKKLLLTTSTSGDVIIAEVDAKHPEEKNGDFTLSISGQDEIKVYLNGVRIHIDWNSDSNLKSKKPNSP